MKKFLLSAIAMTLVAGPLAATAAQAAPQHSVTTVKQRPNGTVVTKTRTWRAGDRFDRRYATSYTTLTNWRGYRLSAPPRGHHWVRSGRDAVLIRDNGTVVRVVSHRF